MFETDEYQQVTLVPFIRNPYNYDLSEASLKTGLECKDPSLTSQEFAQESDINYMLEQFGVTGQINGNAREALEGDFSEVGDYRSMLDSLKAARDAFSALPAKVRLHFENDPAQFVDFVQTEGNREQLREWGLLAPTPDAPIPIVKMDDLVAALDRLSAAKNTP